ncbi:MAG: hypothetical protein IJQ35_01890 [Bacteroidales bacterium]|nr:hypothetical protein [Bacteroidales bacterium]
MKEIGIPQWTQKRKGERSPAPLPRNGPSAFVFSPETSVMDQYVGWLRSMFKSVNANDVFVGVYLTGILPIKKYNSQSALNNFADIVLIPRKNVDLPALSAYPVVSPVLHRVLPIVPIRGTILA